MISFIIPAHNEAFEIAKTLGSVVKAMSGIRQPFEIIVVNDASTDGTADMARAAGARVVDVNLRKISAVRNAGALAAKGDVFFFIDADTQISDRTLRAAIQALGNGAIGGGAWVTFEEPVSLGIKMLLPVFNVLYMRILRWAAGCFVYARREAFEAVKGFDEKFYACEEILLSMALKRRGPFVILRENVLTSNRKMRMYSPLRIIPLVARFVVHGPAIFQERRGLEWWYEGKREK